MHKIIRLLIPALLVLFFRGTSHAQEYRIRNFGSRQGITNRFVYTINQDSRGYIWMGTGEGLCRFDGFEFSKDVKQDSLAHEVAGISYKDSSGNLWFGYYSGDIARIVNSRVESINTGMEIKCAITGFAEFDKDNLLVGTLNQGLILLNKNSGKAVKLPGTEGVMCTALLVHQNNLLIGTPDGLSLYNLDRSGRKAGMLFIIKELEFVKIQDIQPSLDGKGFWIATEDQGVLWLTLSGDRYSVTKTGEGSKLENEKVQSVFEDSEKQLWISSFNGIFRLDQPDGSGRFARVSHFGVENGLPGNPVKKVFEDLEGNIWIATYGEGISLLSGQAFSFSDYMSKGLDNDIQSITVTSEGIIYLGGSQGLFSQKQGSNKSAERVKGLPAERISALAMADQNLLVGTENGLFALNLVNSAARKIPYDANSLGNSINSIAVDEAGVYLGTKDGVYRFDRELHETAHFTTSEGLPHNNIECVFIDSHKRLLVATRTNGIYSINSRDTVENTLPVGKSEIEFKSVTEDNKGGIWAATYGDGVFMFHNDTVYHFTMSQGLKSDYCYSIIGSSNQSIWIGHREGSAGSILKISG
jgi:ligand-binding sensor domain-containing protein